MKNVHLLFSLVASLALCAGAAQAAPFAYVPNEKSGTISVIDTATDTVAGEIPAGKRPRGLAVSPDGKFIYVSDQPANGIHVIDIAARAIVASINLGESPEGVGISPDGRWVAVAVEESPTASPSSTPQRARWWSTSRSQARTPSTRYSAPTASGSTQAPRKATSSM